MPYNIIYYPITKQFALLKAMLNCLLFLFIFLVRHITLKKLEKISKQLSLEISAEIHKFAGIMDFRTFISMMSKRMHR